MNIRLLTFLMLAISFTACNKESLQKEPITKDTTLDDLLLEEDGKEEEDKVACFDLVYPISILMPDDSTLSGNKETLWAAVKEWYENHPDVVEKPNLIYPIDIVWEEDKVETLNDEAAMEKAKEYCKNDKKDCYQYLLPITWMMPDESLITIAEKEDWANLDAWYEMHPDVVAKPTLQLPVDINWGDDQVETITDQAALDLANEYCDDHKKDCFEMVFPISWTMPDESIIVQNTPEEEEAIKTWYENHPDVAAEPTLNYPVEIVYEDGATQLLANEEEWNAAVEDCE